MRDSLLCGMQKSSIVKCGTRCNFAFRKCTNHQNPALRVFNGRKCTKNGAIYPQKRYTFTNKVGQYAISIPLIGSQSRHSHPIKSAFYAILLRFSWDIGIYSATTPLTAERKPQVVDKQTLAALFVSQKLHQKCTDFLTLSRKTLI